MMKESDVQLVLWGLALAFLAILFFLFGYRGIGTVLVAGDLLLHFVVAFRYTTRDRRPGEVQQ